MIRLPLLSLPLLMTCACLMTSCASKPKASDTSTATDADKPQSPSQSKAKSQHKSKQVFIDAVPRSLHIVIGGMFSPSYSVDLMKDGTLFYVARIPSDPSLDKREPLQITPDQWVAFRRELDKANVWHWSAMYANPGGADGVMWTFEAEYEDHAQHTAGQNAFPKGSSFQRVLNAVRKLVGGRPFH